MTTPNISIQRIYVKDLSLETPNSPHIFLSAEPMNVDINLDVSSQSLGNSVFEVVERVTVTARAGDKIAYLVELKQAVIAEVTNTADEAALAQVLTVNMPHIIHPYARAHIADFLIRAGFGPFNLPDISFEQVAQAQRAQIATAA